MTDSSKKDRAAGLIERMATADASEYLGVAVATMNTWRTQGKGPKFYRLAGRVFYRRADLDAYVEACAVETEGSRAA